MRILTDKSSAEYSSRADYQALWMACQSRRPRNCSIDERQTRANT